MPTSTSKPPSSSLSSAPDASPLYRQLARQLAQDIRGGLYRADQALPSERVLAQSLAVSRVTARKAIAVLVEQGLVLPRHGSGNFIAPRLEQTLSQLTGFSEELRQRGYVPTSTWLVREACTADAAACVQLQLGVGAQIARLERLRLADGTPMAVEVTVLPIAALPQPQALDGSLYTTLAATPYAPVRAVQHIRACNADARVAGLLGVPIATALLWVSRTAYLASGAPVEYTVSHCRSDYYDFVVELPTPLCST
jgi:GntR family transcriptional regulator